MKIQQISVKKLFGIFNHEIPLNNEERVTIIHGPNGFGKTIILKFLSAFFNGRYSIFRKIPFDTFIISFDDKSIIEVGRKNLETAVGRTDISITHTKLDSKSDSTTVIDTKNSEDLGFPISRIENLVPQLNRIDAELWEYYPTNEVLSLSEVLERFAELLPGKMQNKKEPIWLKTIRESINVHLIESQRLLNVNVSPKKANRFIGSGLTNPLALPTVSAYSDELAVMINTKLAEYGTTSQSLDRTFPMRVVQQHLTDLTTPQLREKLEELEKTRHRLIEVGLLEESENLDFQIQSPDIDENLKNILSVYVADVEMKLNVFEEIAEKIDLFKRIVNSKFAYSQKEIRFSKEKGFVFESGNQSNGSGSKLLSPTDLSSGEQHELVLLYELLFKVRSNSLVLIDEPELSLHVSWQAQFLDDLQEITKLTGLNILMATHSPDIIQGRFDLTVELKKENL